MLLVFHDYGLNEKRCRGKGRGGSWKMRWREGREKTVRQKEQKNMEG